MSKRKRDSDRAHRIIKRLAPGQDMMYHEGFLAQDIEHNSDLAAYAHRFWLAGHPKGHQITVGINPDRTPGALYIGLGEGYLWQHRLSNNKYGYFFTKRSKHNGF